MNNEDNRLKLGRIIRAKRNELGYSQEDFADHCGLHRTYMGSVERGERNISLDNILKIATGLGITAGELIKDAEL